MASVVFFIQHVMVAVARFVVELIKIHQKASTSQVVKERHIERRDPLWDFFTKLLRSDTLQDFFFVVVRSFTADSNLLQPTVCVNSTPHTSHFLVDQTRTRVAQVVTLACAPHNPCVIFMRSCCVFDSLRLLHFLLLVVHLLSYRLVFPLGHQLCLARCGGQIPCALQLMRTLAPLPSTTLSKTVSPTTSTSRRLLNRTSSIFRRERFHE